MTGAGDLREVIEFQTRTEEDDGYGNVVTGPFATVWSAPARIQILRGSETVIAGRLAGKQTIAATIRWQPDVATLTSSAWRAKNGRTGELMNIRSIEPDERKSFVNILCETGVAS
ncbi:phage head closure protein [Rhizobium mesoamericanum]|uniref:phage head closure protein n=1 Tax=Rhizobium mesoamericanum TaxID=1079800 RepID=UPI0004249EA9|nr:phage head closure protein [Rhizobium mesoamericanum]